MWPLRTVDPEFERAWRAAGYWTDDTVGQLLDRGLQALAAEPFTVHSAVRPWRGTLGQVRERALDVAGELRRRGVGPGDVVAFQLPNWVEAAVTFYAAAFLGAVVVPIVHFYGPKEVSYILRRTDVRVFVTYDQFGALSGRAVLEAAALSADDRPELIAVVGADSGTDGGLVAFETLATGDPLPEPRSGDPAAPALVAYTSGTTADPKGVVHSHRTIGFESRQLAATQAEGAPSTLVGAPVGHAIGMLAALLVPLVGSIDPPHRPVGPGSGAADHG